jgi:hypothetical protein
MDSSSQIGSNSRAWRVRHAVDYLEARLADDVDLDDIAAEVGLSAAETYLDALGWSTSRPARTGRGRSDRAEKCLYSIAA